MASMNVVMLIGRVVAAPELRYTATGKAVCSYTLAVDRRSRGSDRDSKETDFIPVVAWDRLGEICNEYLTKGKLISIQGRLQTRTYETQDGQKRKAFEINANEMQMLDRGNPGSDERGSAPERGGQERQSKVPVAAAGPNSWGQGAGFEDVGMDDVPF